MTVMPPGMPTTPFPALPRELDEAALAVQAPLARGQLLSRLERLLRLAEDNLEGLDGEKPDPRWAELAVRIVKEEAKLYRLDKPAPAEVPDEPDEAQDTTRLRSLVLAQMDELAARTAS